MGSYNRKMKKKCFDVWEYLEATGCSEKGEAYIELDLEDDYCECAACAVANYRNGPIDCSLCPMYGSWRTNKLGEVSDTCSDNNSTYYVRWLNAKGTDDKRKYAGLMKRNIIDCWPDDLNYDEAVNDEA